MGDIVVSVQVNLDNGISADGIADRLRILNAAAVSLARIESGDLDLEHPDAWESIGAALEIKGGSITTDMVNEAHRKGIVARAEQALMQIGSGVKFDRETEAQLQAALDIALTMPDSPITQDQINKARQLQCESRARGNSFRVDACRFRI